MLCSNYMPLCPVTLPFAGRQHYMHTLDLSRPEMASGFEDYIEPVMALCKAVGATTGLAHMTVDEKIIEAGMSQRRPGPHVDGCYMPDKAMWGHSGGGWLHYCNNVPAPRMPIIVASSVPGCKVWRGKFDAEPRNDGDLSHLELGEGEIVPANRGYLLSPDCIHESMRFEQDTRRTFLRIAFPSLEAFHPLVKATLEGV